ncbi:hypothetical protein GCM10007874_56150 [Labrys miyagiensis]|uniref:Esterase/lipase superfamily enzyme n=1 Tax=Labrys miyagiensis TaxID=346912 RepID=A0ABQ6CR44_9HYPH|nr:alpha/beta hydrolase [Labrys miyagiensis]GLS22595.1 hypothetical protein GCM10007874_56150 [Labrys miyagiensis]
MYINAAREGPFPGLLGSLVAGGTPPPATRPANHGIKHLTGVSDAVRRGKSRPEAGSSSALRRLLACSLVVAAALLSGCASRPESGFLRPVSGSATGASEHTLLIATTRERDSRPGTLFNGDRSGALDYATVTVSVPPKHVSGQVEWPSSPHGNPQSDFVVRKAAYIDGEKAFIRTLNARLDAQPPGKRKVLVFIHGYNTMFAEGLYRFSQIIEDSNSPAVPVLFTWSSQGSLTGYVYDTNSATVARDDLEHTLRLIAASDADEINIVAHSMGNWVTVEAIRQIKISGDTRGANKVGAIILAAPDIDLDVFKSEMKRIGRLRKPFFIVVSKDDQALQFSRFIAGDRPRLGADSNVQELAALGAIVIDLTTLKGNDPLNHGKFAQLANVAPELERVLQDDTAAGKDSVPKNQR